MAHDIRAAFNSVRARGFALQVLEAYDELDDPILPNDVPAALTGAIVSVTCTLEKALFKGARYGPCGQYQMYANTLA
jgi:hypothetical protein